MFSFKLFARHVGHFAVLFICTASLNNVETIELYLCPGFSMWMLMENNQMMLLFVNIQSFIIDFKCCYLL